MTSTNSAGTILQHLHLTPKDRLGYLDSITDQRPNTVVAGIETSETQSFQYDDVYRLMSASGSYGMRGFNYDPDGNIRQNGLLNITYSGQTFNITQTGAPAISGSYDDAGLLHDKSDSAGNWTYAYDDERHLAQVMLGSNAVASFDYAHDGRRVKKVFTDTAGSSVTTFYGDGYELRVSTADPGATSTTVYVADPMGILATVTTGGLPGQPTDTTTANASSTPWSGDTSHGPAIGTYFQFANGIGGTSVITDSSGTPLARVQYEPYGQIATANSIGLDGATFKFAGKERDAESGFSYFGARYYDPILGRFTTPDSNIPVLGTSAQVFNRYAFAVNNPLRFSDPSGEEPFDPRELSGTLGSFTLQFNDFITPYVNTVKTVADRVLGPLPGVGQLYHGAKALGEADDLSAQGKSPVPKYLEAGAYTAMGVLLFLAPPSDLIVVGEGAGTAGLTTAGVISAAAHEAAPLVPPEGPPAAEVPPPPPPPPNSGPVYVKPPPNATPDQLQQVQDYVRLSNQALDDGLLSPTGRVSTQGTLRQQASQAAAAERAQAAAAGTPYQGHAGHAPDTTWTGNPVPPYWLDLDPVVNSSIGGQSNGYPIGYQPTEFIFSP